MLERWIADRPFREARPPGQSDLDVARGTHAREILQDHWQNWIVESDWAWLAETGINTVRIPVSLLEPVNPVPAPGREFRAILLPGILRSAAPPWTPKTAMLSAVAHDMNPLAFLSCSHAFRRTVVVLDEPQLTLKLNNTLDWVLSCFRRRSFRAAWHRVRRLRIYFR